MLLLLPKVRTNSVVLKTYYLGEEAAETFDESAVRAQTEKLAQQYVIRQVAIARVQNQMYNLLTPEQRQILDQKHQQRLSEIELQMSEMNQTSAQKPVLINK